MAISKDELLKGRDKQYPKEYTKEISDNLDKLLVAVNQIRSAYATPMTVTSGWRPAEINASTPGAAKKSKHMIGLAVDIQDKDNRLMNWVLANLKLMKQLDIYVEDFRWTPGWVHFQLGKPTSGKRIFVPSADRAQAPDRWNGEYNHAHDSIV